MYKIFKVKSSSSAWGQQTKKGLIKDKNSFCQANEGSHAVFGPEIAHYLCHLASRAPQTKLKQKRRVPTHTRYHHHYDTSRRGGDPFQCYFTAPHITTNSSNRGQRETTTRTPHRLHFNTKRRNEARQKYKPSPPLRKTKTTK